MRKFLVSYRSINMGRVMGFGNAVVKLDDGEKLTPEALDKVARDIKEQNGFKSIVILAFSEFDKE